MDKQRKKTFIRELIRAVEREIISKVFRMPEEWDGIELRRYIAAAFRDCAIGDFPPARKRRFLNEIAVRNL